MGSKIHYEEDSFLLKEMIKTLRRGCSIDIDPSIFLEYTINQLLFISKALKELYSSKTELVHLKSPEHIRGLIRVSTSFTELLDDLMNDRLKFADYCRNYTEDFRKIEKDHSDAAAELKETLDAISTVSEREQLVSEEEFMFLLQDNENDSE
ncbi:MAG: hypothetical protein JEZ04_16605 [Spirochaetales bacterium]|nr:hypothetical protein [Spirochaetales bacterium]